MQSNNWRFSFIIPSYNPDPELLRQAVNSCLSTGYLNIEVIVVDDGSTSKCVFSQIADLDKRINVVTQENQGLAAARNTGINLSTGDYLIFVDDDDLVHPGFISAAMSCLSKYPESTILYSDTRDLGHFNNNCCSLHSKEFSPAQIVSFFCDLEKGEASRLGVNRFSAWAKIFPRFLFQKGARFDPKQGYIGEDRLFLFSNMMAFQRICCIYGKPMYFYRQRTLSITNGYKPSIRTKYSQLAERLVFACKGNTTMEHQVYFDVLNIHFFNVCSMDIFNKNSEARLNQKIAQLRQYAGSALFQEALNSSIIRSIHLKKRFILRLVKWKMYFAVGVIFSCHYRRKG